MAGVSGVRDHEVFVSTYYQDQKVSTSGIVGAIALAALHDVRVNSLSIAGVPQIAIEEADDELFTVTLSWTDRNGQVVPVRFLLEQDKAFEAARKFKVSDSHDHSIFEAVQEALAELEGKVPC